MYAGDAWWYSISQCSCLSQGVNEGLQPQLQQAIAHSAARYGHVMHPENAHEPAVAAAEALLGSVGKGWAHRVFFSADGSGPHWTPLAKLACLSCCSRPILMHFPP